MPTTAELNSETFQSSRESWSWGTPGVIDTELARWSRGSGATPTLTSGPNGGADAETRAVTSGNSYAFTESSPPATGPYSLESPAFDASEHILTLIFDLHMWFGAEGNIRDGRLQVQGFDGSTYRDIGPAVVGSKQRTPDDQWLPSTTFGTYDSTNFTNPDFRFRFLFTEGTNDPGGVGANYDCAVDNVTITGRARQGTDVDRSAMRSAFVPAGFIETYAQNFDAPGLSLADLIDTDDATSLPDDEVMDRADARAANLALTSVKPFFPSFLTFRVHHLAGNGEACFKTHDLDTGAGTVTPRSQDMAMHELAPSGKMLLRAYDLANFPGLNRADYQSLNHIGGMLSTERHFSQRRGYWEARLKVNQMGAGHHFSFWLLPIRPRFDASSATPEIDIVEIIDSNRSSPNGGLNMFAFNNHGNDDFPLPSDDGAQVFRFLAHGHGDANFEGQFFDNFHTFGFLWDANQLVWTVDGIEVKRSSNWTNDHFEMYALLTWETRARGVLGDFPNAAADSTPWPAEVEIDYLRVYRAP